MAQTWSSARFDKAGGKFGPRHSGPSQAPTPIMYPQMLRMLVDMLNKITKCDGHIQAPLCGAAKFLSGRYHMFDSFGRVGQ